MIPRKLINMLLVGSAVLMTACKGTGHASGVDSNTFDSAAVGQPLVVDTTIAGVSDTNSTEPSPYDKADSLATKQTDSLIKP